jgi:hypothetical protein
MKQKYNKIDAHRDMFVSHFPHNSPCETTYIRYKVRIASETQGQLVRSDDSQFCRHVLPNVNDRVKSATSYFSFQFELKPGNQIKILVLAGEYEG